MKRQKKKFPCLHSEPSQTFRQLMKNVSESNVNGCSAKASRGATRSEVILLQVSFLHLIILPNSACPAKIRLNVYSTFSEIKMFLLTNFQSFASMPEMVKKQI